MMSFKIELELDTNIYSLVNPCLDDVVLILLTLINL
jgi:hypothetical protein